MQLSEAIRLGAMLKPQAFNRERGDQLARGWRGWLLRRREQTTCAFAAALDANPLPTKMILATQGSPLRGMAVTDGLYMKALDIPDEWQVIYEHRRCPQCVGHPLTVYHLISHLNDTHRWTREQIADFVQTIESERQPASEAASITNTVARTDEQPQAVTSRR